MEYFEAPQVIHTTKPSVFLAGGISNCPDWQAEAVRAFANLNGVAGRPLGIAVFNPRRQTGFPMPWTREQSEIQIRWEFDAIAAADVVMFWFPAGESVQPIALFELGSHLHSGKRICVGRDPGYSRADDIDVQVSLVNPELTVHHSLDETIAMAAKLLGFL